MKPGTGNDPALRERIDRLYRRNLHTVKLGLETVRALLAELGDPQRAWLSIHVAGTNGKGSVCALLESALRASGIRTARYTSPHLVRFNERIQVAGVEINDAQLVQRMDEVERACQSIMKSGRRDATFFEFTTALAFLHFKREGAELAVIETGMGGRLDATNILDPLVTVITSIGLDHQAFLGPDLASIAAEKAGILKKGRPSVVGPLPEEADAVIRAKAKAVGCTLQRADDIACVRRTADHPAGQRIVIETQHLGSGRCVLPLYGRHQLVNATIAAATLDILAGTYRMPLEMKNLAAGLSQTDWPGRFQLLSVDPPIVLDGGHNPDGVEALARSLKERFSDRPIAFILGFLADKDVGSMCRIFARVGDRAWAVAPDSERALPSVETAAQLGVAGLSAEQSTLIDAIEAATRWATSSGGVVCIAGSLYLVGDVLRIRP